MSVQSIITSMTNDTAKVTAEKNAAKTDKSELDQDAFLQLLMTQLKNQDPTNPMDTDQFMSQQAQFTQISELQKLNKSLSNSTGLMQASSFIGKEVTVTDPDNTSSTVTGVVSEATVDSSGANIVFSDGKAYPVSSVISVKEKQSSES